MSTKFKLAKFEGSDREGRTADIIVDDTVKGWVERDMNYEWFGMQRKWSVAGYSITLYDEEDNMQHDFKTLPEVRAFLKTKFA